MDEKYKKRVCIEFCSKCGKLATETFSILQVAFENCILSKSRAFGFLKNFQRWQGIH